ncbi:hypothetical protein GOP47_0016115 [Adiantum capillus-veneris]|uniref:Uncharacterized protein n=1 Tax=Adiantum capillus-veneris TaxID=13818 RepID=A0A9D4UKY7_ADICA|nr:hypothetical protein GOP47_0016115 [Adiantum capillus-veneris]
MVKIVCLQEPQKDCDVKLLIPALGDWEDQLGSIVVYAASARLSGIPFFQASLREPWQWIGPKKICELKLRCIPHCSPEDYMACFKFLVDSDHPKMLIKSVLDATKIMRCADHLLFKGCVDVCMQYLAAAPWSDEEERAVRNAVSSMGLPRSLDLVVRLDEHLDELHIFKEFFTKLIVPFQSKEVEAIVKDAMTNAPYEMIKSFYKPLFLQVLSEFTQRFLSDSNDILLRTGLDYGHTTVLIDTFFAGYARMRDEWVSFTYTLLLYAVKKAEIAKMITNWSSTFEVINAYLPAFFTASPNIASLLINIFEGAISIEHGTMIFLSNSERASLLVAWAPVVDGIDDAKLHVAFKNVFTTLPPRHPSSVQLLRANHRKPFFEPCYVWWWYSLSKMFKHSHFLLDHIRASPQNIEYYTNLLTVEHK